MSASSSATTARRDGLRHRLHLLKQRVRGILEQLGIAARQHDRDVATGAAAAILRLEGHAGIRDLRKLRRQVTLEHDGCALAVGPQHEKTTGAYFNGLKQARANEQAYDPEAQRKLRELSLKLAGLDG